MDELRVLEYDKIIKLLAERTVSVLGAGAAGKLLPLSNFEAVKERLDETEQSLYVMMKKGTLPIGEFGDIKEAAVYAEKGGVLSMDQLLKVARQLEIADRVVKFLKSDVPDAGILINISLAIQTDRDLKERITRSIISDTEMADSASSELKRIRRGIDLQNEKIRVQLNKMITSSTYSDILRDQIITQRDGRWVVPVKQEHAGRVPGTHLGRSKGGATVFVEPAAVTASNNALRELEAAENDEIYRILAEISAQVGELSYGLCQNQDLLTTLDLISAKGRLADDFKGVRAAISDTNILEISGGRHPLIDPETVVPVSLHIGDGYKALIITGPNTGGKTVTLKTAGLMILMTLAGLFVPADKAVIPLVDKVFADIGDEQSIEQSLSTFSSHMSNIVTIMKEADSRSIALLDELGAGTDPTEGAALAISILDELLSRDTLVMATTHYTELKKYAMSQDMAINASMEFDIETLSPTYRLRLGIPGSSNAFEISRRLGLSDKIVEMAAERMDSGSIAFESVINEAERDRRAAADKLSEAENMRESVQRDKEAFEQRRQSFEEKRSSLLEKAREEAKEKISDAEEYADIIKAELKALLDDAADYQETEALRGEIFKRLDDNRKHLRSLEEELTADPEAKSVATGGRRGADKGMKKQGDPASRKARNIEPGDTVIIKSLGQEAEVITGPDERGELNVQAGRIRMKFHLSDLKLIDTDAPNAKSSSSGRGAARESSGRVKIVRSKVQTVQSSVDVHGLNLDDATIKVDKYLDDAYLAGLREVSVIHGRGEGILKNGLRRMLKSHKHVKSSRPGGPYEGSDGVTIISLKD